MGKRLAGAKAELERAQQAAEKLKVAATPSSVDDAWKDFIGRLARLWFKTEAALKGNPRFYNSPWVKLVKEDRKSDPLIQYVFQARHADEHGNEDVTTSFPRGIGIGPVDQASGSMSMTGLYVDANGRVVIEGPADDVRVRHIPEERLPLPVHNHGQTYNLPGMHLGKPIQPLSLANMARLAVAYYTAVIEGLEADGWDRDHESS